MFTSMDLDDELFNQAFALSPHRTKKAFFEEMMRLYIRLHEQADVKRLRGQLLWKGDLEEIRGERLANRR